MSIDADERAPDEMAAERPHDGFHLIFEGVADGDWGGLLERGVEDGGQFDEPLVAKNRQGCQRQARQYDFNGQKGSPKP